MSRLLRPLAMLVVSAALIAAGIGIMRHQSSAAFELGLFLCAVGGIHWVFWPHKGD